MKHSTYQKLYQAHLGVIDQKGLAELRNQEKDPFYQNLIDLVIENNAPHVEWNTRPFNSDFLSGSPRKKLDETFLAFVLRIVAIIKEESYVRTFKKPESHQPLIAWIAILRNLLICSLGLLYNVRWTTESIMNHLEPAIMKMFSEGDAFVLRRLMKDLGVELAQEEPYPAEQQVQKLNFLQIQQFGSFFWRFMHWMAEADATRTDKDADLYKLGWRQLLIGPLYRTLRCGICMHHFRKMLDDANLLTVEDLPKAFFEMHNKTHQFRREALKYLQEPNYTEAEYANDSEFMRRALMMKEPYEK